MYRFIKFALPVLALAAFAFLPKTSVRADDPPATQPAGKGSVTFKVVDADGKAVAGATVQIFPPRTAGAAGGGRGGRGGAGGAGAAKPVAEGKTDDTGSFTFKDIAAGEYAGSARSGTGNTTLQGRTMNNFTIAAGAAGDPVTITVKARAARGGGNGGGGNAGNGN